ncbi:protein kinase, partial [Striga asiatica]
MTKLVMILFDIACGRAIKRGHGVVYKEADLASMRITVTDLFSVSFLGKSMIADWFGRALVEFLSLRLFQLAITSGRDNYLDTSRLFLYPVDVYWDIVFMEQAPEKKFPLNSKDYELYEEVGEGVSATVYRAHCVPLNEIVAIKVLDLEKCNNDLDNIRREVQTMILIDHPNLLRAHCSFTAGHNLWVVMPYMAGGSCLHIMKSAYPEGFEEPVIATLLREVLKALVYLHHHGHIHRDVKAGNILLDSDGSVKLADFGVAACMYDTGDRQRSRNTFVGTPCWMAPEVMQQLHGYDFKADIWSFGITALELAHGHAPFSKYPPMKVLLMTLQNAPPGLDYERDKRFSKSFKEMVAACLVKDPKKRPSSEKLLKHSFFKHARSNEYLDRTILNGLNPLGERFRVLKAKEADMLVQNKASYEDKEQLSQQEYIRGVSAWNFDLEDLKNQAALIQDDFTSNSEDSSVSGKNMDVQEESFSEKADHSKDASQMEDELNGLNHLEGSLAVFPEKPLQALKGLFDVCEEDDAGTGSPSSRGSVHSDSEQTQQQPSTSAVGREATRNDSVDSYQSGSFIPSALSGRKKFPSGSLLHDNVLSPKKLFGDGDREYLQPRYQSERNHSGPLQYRQKKDLSAGDDTSEGAIVERRGRFKVTSGDLSSKVSTNMFNSVSSGPTSPITPNAASFLPSLQCILQQNTAQREELVKLIKLVEQTSGNAI